jgi:hypothetical protein
MVIYFFFYKIKEGRTGHARRGGLEQWEGGGSRERVWRMNMVQILCTHVCKWKNDTC